MKSMNLLKKASMFMIVGSLGVAAAPAFSKDNGKSLAKGKTKTESVGKHGREDGELPFGLEQLTTKKGELPGGLQKKQDEDGSLTRGLQEGGKELKTTTKAKGKSKK